MNNFQRGKSPRVGDKEEIEKWLNDKIKGKGSCSYYDDPDEKNIVLIDVDGNLVLEEEKTFKIKYVFRKINGNLTILSKLSFTDIKERIKLDLNNKFNECVGKPIEVKTGVIFGEPNKYGLQRNFSKLDEYIKNADLYLNGIDNENALTLEEQLSQGCLEPFLDSVDEFGASLRDYHKTIEKNHLK